MGISCSSFQPAVNCAIVFDKANGVSALGNVLFGQLQSNPDIAGIGTVLAFVISSGVALLISFILMISRILDRVPPAIHFINKHPIIRRIVPSPTEQRNLPALNWSLPTFSWNFFSAPSEVGTPLEPYTAPNQFQSLGEPEPPNYNPQVVASTFNPPIHQYQRSAYNLQDMPSPSNIGDNYRKILGSPGNRAPSLNDEYQFSGEEDNNAVVVVDEIILRKLSFPEQMYDCLEAALFSVPDSQVLLAIALAGTFLAEGRCTLTQYHVDVAVNLILLACINYGLAFIFVRNYWESKAALLRILLFCIVLGFLGWLFHLQQSVGLSPERLPPSSRANSMILLDAECFLNTTSASVLGNLTTQEYDIVGFPDRNLTTTPENICFVLVVAISSINMVIRLAQFFWKEPSRVHVDPENGGPTLTSWLLFVWWTLTWGASVGLYIISAKYIFGLRQWAAQSGWIQLDQDGTNPEGRIHDFGQLSAIVATAGVVVAGVDRIKTYREKEKEG